MSSMRIKSLYAVLLMVGIVAPAYGQTQAASAESQCVRVNISLSFSFDGTTSAAAKYQLDERLYKLNAFLIQNRIDHLETQYMYYKVAEQNNNVNRGSNNAQPAASSTYRLSGTAEYQIDSTDNAFKLGQFFTQEKFQVTVSNKPASGMQCNTSNPAPAKNPAAAAPKANVKSPTDLDYILKAKPPSDEKDTDTSSGRNGDAPELPSLDEDPPETLLLKEKR